MNTLIISDEFGKWFSKLRDKEGRYRITVKMRKVVRNNFGDSKSVGGGIFEMKIDTGPGYRIYYAIKENTVYWILNGGDKSTQSKDIQRARDILNRMQER
jgi:putative addiction module killer protein